jgi:alpha-N-arabinofuranosidase
VNRPPRLTLICWRLLIMDRRTFLKTGAAAFAVGATTHGVAARQTSATESRVEVLLDEPGATIAPETYGHFVEHLGGVVYDGIWVGENSRIANVGGLRKELIDALKRVKPGMVRWPGGCFADQYSWRDGVGPREKRPRRTNFWVDDAAWPANANRHGPQSYDPNAFGTPEFIHFCEQVGAQPYFASNLRSSPAQELYRWIEYCNSPSGSTTLSDERASDGHPEPMNVKYWGVGNESWGCGGEFDPEDYASELRRYSAWMPKYGVDLHVVGSGPNDAEFSWTRRCFEKLARGGEVHGIWGWAAHHYAWNASGKAKTEWSAGKGDALRFDAEQYYSILHQAAQIESIIRGHWDVMAEHDPRHRVKLVLDEWGAWYAPGTEPFAEALLGQQNTMRDAVVAGLTLDIFNCHAEKVAMSSVAQLVNCLQSLFLAHEDKFCVTPTYHVFAMYVAHQGGQSVRTMTSAPHASYSWNGAPAALRGLSGSGSLKGKTLTLTVTNPSLEAARDTEIVIRGGKARSVSGHTLAAGDVHAHNSFEDPKAVAPKSITASLRGSGLTFTFPPASVTRFELMLS